VYPKWRASYAVALLLALVPLAYLVRLCVLRTVDVPQWDEWELAPRLDRLYGGGLTFHDFWGQHNEHRPLVPIAILLTLARATRWDTRWEVGLNVVVSVLIFAVYCAYLLRAWRARGAAPIWLVPALSLLAFSPIQWENWLFGWQLTLLLCALFGTLAVYLVAHGKRPVAFWSAIGCALCATYSFGSGLTLWPALAPGVWITGGPRRAKRLAIWIGSGAFAYASYFYDFHAPQGSMLANFASLAAVRAYVQYVFTQIGTPIAAFHLGLAFAAGVAGVAALAALAIHLRRLRDDPVYLFPVLLGAFTLAASAVSGLGRASMGVEQATASRYTTLTLPLWCAVTCLAVLWRATAPAAQPRRHQMVTAVTVLLLLGRLGSAVKSTRQPVAHAAGRSEVMMYARRGLLTGQSEALLKLLYPVVSELRARRAIVMRLRLSVFRPAAQPSYPLPGPQ